MAAGPSPSIEPLFPCISTSGSRSFFLALVSAQEWDEITPACSLLWLLVLALQFVEILVAQYQAMLADRLEEGFVLLDVVEVAELVNDGVGHLHVVLLEPVAKEGLTLLLYFS